MNPYNSMLRTLRARNVFEGVMPAIPANLSIAFDDWKPAIFNTIEGGDIGAPFSVDQTFLNINSNMICKRIGLFSNFADGLVPATATPGVDVIVRVASFTRGNPASGGMTVTGDPSSKTMTVTAGAIADLSAGDWILLTEGENQLINKDFREYAQVLSVNVPGGTFDLYDYPKFDYSNSILLALTAISESSRFVTQLDIAELNVMNHIDTFFTPAEYSSVAATDIIIFGQVVPNGTSQWFTKSINTAFAGDVLSFDLVGDFEITVGPEV